MHLDARTLPVSAKRRLFPLYIAALIWGALYLRDERLRALIPLRR